MDKSDMKPCPFCGSSGEVLREEGTNWTRVRCTWCHCSVGSFYADAADAITMWNQRHLDLDPQHMRVVFKSWSAEQQRQWLKEVLAEHVYYATAEGLGPDPELPATWQDQLMRADGERDRERERADEATLRAARLALDVTNLLAERRAQVRELVEALRPLAQLPDGRLPLLHPCTVRCWRCGMPCEIDGAGCCVECGLREKRDTETVQAEFRFGEVRRARALLARIDAEKASDK